MLLDAGRYTRLIDAGWRIYRFTKYQVYAEPAEIVATIRRALAATLNTSALSAVGEGAHVAPRGWITARVGRVPPPTACSPG